MSYFCIFAHCHVATLTKTDFLSKLYVFALNRYDKYRINVVVRHADTVEWKLKKASPMSCDAGIPNLIINVSQQLPRMISNNLMIPQRVAMNSRLKHVQTLQNPSLIPFAILLLPIELLCRLKVGWCTPGIFMIVDIVWHWTHYCFLNSARDTENDTIELRAHEGMWGTVDVEHENLRLYLEILKFISAFLSSHRRYAPL